MKKLLAKIRKILHDRRTRRFLTRFVSGVAALIVFVTTYALVLPAITMEKEANCGIEAHQHDDSCYNEELICDIPESDGHHHDESCYSTTSALVCETEEHEHSAENGCYDDEGNLICEVMEHRHNEECYEEVRELTCQIPESEGHHHTEDCYEKVLTCGKEVHVHSTACYENDPVSESAIAASTSSAAASTTSVGSVSSAGMTLNFEGDIEKIIDADEPVDGDPVDNLGSDKTNGSSETNDTSEIASSSETNTEAASDTEVTYGRENAGTGRTETSNTALTNADNNATALTSSADTDQYIPQLDAVDFNTVLNNHTGIYYYRAADEDIVEDSSAIPAEDWNRIPNNIDRINDDMDDVELGNKDLLRVYLSYTIPAGSLNATNPVARYRLPSNLHLTDPQVKAINENVNGLAGQYVDMSTLEITDPDKYNAYLGVEAVEGTRRPDEAVEDYLAEQAWKASKDAENATEYISAVVRVENVYDADGLYGEKDAYLGQDLIFTFAPYSIEKNQHEYDSTGKPTKAGEEIKGWFTFDLNMGQVDFEEPEITTSTVKESDTENAKGDNKDNQIGKDDPEDIKPDAGFGEDDNHQNEHSEDSHSVDNSAADHESVMDAESGKEAENTSKSLVTIKRSERSAEIVFIEDGWDEKGNKINQISTTLTAVEKIMVEAQDDDTEENNTETAREDESTATTDNTTEKINNDETEKTASDDKEDTVDVSSGKKTLVDSEESDQIIMPAMSFTDSIKVSTGKPSGIDENAGGILADAAESLPEKAKVLVRVEADEGTFPAGTKMVLKAVTKEDMEALAETVANTVEKDSSDSVENSVPNTNTGDNKKNNVNRQNNNSNSSSNIKAFGFQAVDITFFDKDGNEIEPAKPVRVALTSKTVEQVRKEAENSPIADPVVVHVDNDGNAEQMELVVPEDVEPAKGKTEEELNETIAAEETSTAGDDADTADDSDVDTVKQSEKNENKEPQESSEDSSTETSVGDNISSAEDEMGAVEKGTDTEEQLNPDNDETESKGVTAGTGSTVEFEAESFSVYAIVYTVDFYWKVDGKEYVIHIPGGGYISFQKLVEVLGIAREKTDTLAEEKTSEEGQKSENGKTSEKEQTSLDNQNTETNQHANTEENPTAEEQQNIGSIDADGKEDKKENPALLDFENVEVSENTRKFVADVDSIEFSNPSLLSVSKTDHSTTVGAIKDALSLVCEYSAELTEEAVVEINATVVEAGDWALISMKAFDTEEALTVTMKDGEKFQIRVTDENTQQYLNNRTFNLSPDGKSLTAVVSNNHLTANNKNLAANNQMWTFEYAPSGGNTSGWYRIKSAAGDTAGQYIRVDSNDNISLTTDQNSATRFYIDKQGEQYSIGLHYYNGANGVNDPTGNHKYLTLVYTSATDCMFEIKTRQSIVNDNSQWPNSRKPYFTFEEVSPTPPLDKAGDWLLYFDEDLDEITIHVGETITLRPYDEWKWKESDVQRKYWNIDSTKDWTINGSEEDGDGFETWTPSGSPIEFTRYVKYDSELETRYWSVQGQAKETGEFLLTNTENGHVIKVKVVDGDPVPVGTITKTAGIKVNLFDYDKEYVLDPYNSDTNKADSTHKNLATNYNNKPLYFMSSGGGDAGDPDPSKINRYTKDQANPGIVNNRLNTEGYPQLASHSGNSGNLKYLFDTSQVEWAGGDSNNAMKAYPDVEGLFQKDNDGYYYYNSNVNYAYYNPANNNKRITLYEHTYTQNSSQDKNSRANSKPIGFFPFHPYNSTEDLWVNQNNHLNHHIGLSIEVDFTLPSNRLDENGKPIKFEFSGDDDLWVFVEWTKDDGTKDSRLLLDLGGIHQPITGSIDFTNDDTIKNIVETDKPYTLKVFYLERGGCDSNCSIRFNLPITKDLTVAKNVNGLTPAERLKYLDDLFTYEIGIRNDSTGLDMDKTEDEFWNNTSWREGFQLYNTKDNVNTNINKNHTVYHSKTGDQKGYPVKDGQIQLKEGESFTISQLPATDIFYLAEEDQLDMQQFETPHAERLYIGKDGATRQEEEVALHEDHSAANSSMSDWETRPYALKDTERLVYTNTIQERNLDVDKVWQDGQSAHQPVQFRLLATVDGQHYGAATGHNSINAQWTETTNAGTTTRTEDVYTYDASAGSSKLFTLNEDNNWHISFEHLPRKTESANDTGKEIIYTVQEVVPDDYTVTYTGPTDTGKVYLDLYKFWPDGNANHDGSEGKPAEHISTYIKNDVGQYMVAARGSNGEYVYTGMTDNQAEATRFELMTKSALPSGFQSNDQYNMFDYAARVNNVPDGSYYWDEETDEEEATRGMVMFKRPKQEIEILNKKAQINVEKEWLDKDGNALSDHPDSISYSIYQLKHEHEWAVYNTAEKKWDHTQKADGEGWYYIADENVDMRVCRFSSCGHYTETKPHHTEPCQENEHTWDDGEQTKAPTCTLPGSKTFTCTKCGSTRTEEVPASGHSFNDGEITTPATCSATGVKTYTCNVCNAIKKEDIPKTDHTWGAWATDPNNSLREIRECSVCHEKETRLNPNASTIPGTTIQLQDGIWPAGEHDDNEQLTINPGVFEYGGKYYVVYGSKTNTWQNFKNGPDNVLGWGFVAKIDATKGVKNQGDNLNNLTAGQLLKMNDGTYYVWNNAYWGGPSSGPAQDNNWIKVPTSSNNVNGTNSLNTAAGGNRASKSMRKQAKIPVRTLGSENDDQGTEQTGRGPVTDMNLTLTQLLSDLNLTGLGVKNAQGDTLVKYGDSRTLTTTTGTLVENETNLWRETVGVPFKDENGNEYIYYVVEETPAVGGDYDVRYTGQSQGLTDGGTTRISNKVKPREVEVIVVKVDTGNTNTKLAGASFDLYAEASVEGGKVKDNETPLKTGLTTSDQADQLGKVSLGLLTEGTYYLVETKAPNGYNTETSPIKIVVRDDKVSLTQGSSQRDSIITQDRAEVLVTNSAGVELPYTGGPGTRLFYLLGSILILGAGVLLWRRRRLI